MNSVIVLLIAAYVFLLALVVLVLTHGRLHWLFKLLLVIVAAGFYLLSYQGWKQSQGWPSTNDLPAKFLLHASVIEEPDVEAGMEGRIFVWLSGLQDNFPAGEPRAYELPYDKQIHASLEQALRNQRQGNLQIGVTENQRNNPNSPLELQLSGEDIPMLKFNNLPDPALPEK